MHLLRSESFGCPIFLSKIENVLFFLKFIIFNFILLLGELVGAQRQKAEHEPFTSHFERRSGSSKRLRNARAKTRGEDHATPL